MKVMTVCDAYFDRSDVRSPVVVLTHYFCIYYTLCSKKTKPFVFDNNFRKCRPIFKILSQGDS